MERIVGFHTTPLEKKTNTSGFKPTYIRDGEGNSSKAQGTYGGREHDRGQSSSLGRVTVLAGREGGDGYRENAERP